MGVLPPLSRCLQSHLQRLRKAGGLCRSRKCQKGGLFVCLCMRVCVPPPTKPVLALPSSEAVHNEVAMCVACALGLSRAGLSLSALRAL